MAASHVHHDAVSSHSDKVRVDSSSEWHRPAACGGVRTLRVNMALSEMGFVYITPTVVSAGSQ